MQYQRVALCEGIETGLAVTTACPDLPVWATLSTSGMEQLDLPPAAQRVLILADHDASGAGLRAAEATARRLRAQGRDVAIAMPPEEGEDFNDMLLRAGAKTVARRIAAAEQTVDIDRRVPTALAAFLARVRHSSLQQIAARWCLRAMISAGTRDATSSPRAFGLP